ncbi:MAG: hypothetical protein GX984_05500 [Erysipelothrix sp.]|nr:hypothetical protein [Erysipelothrix sp.]
MKKEPTHLRVLEFLKDNYYNDVIDIVKMIKYNVNETNIDFILDIYTGIISERRKILIKRFLIEKVNLIERQFNL